MPSLRHKTMVDFAFYEGVYLGSMIPEKAFYGMAQRARDMLTHFQKIYQVTVPGEDSFNMAVCAMAETFYEASRRRDGMTAATVGQVSVRYESGDTSAKTLLRQLYEKASIYLDIYRGVEA